MVKRTIDVYLHYYPNDDIWFIKSSRNGEIITSARSWYKAMLILGWQYPHCILNASPLGWL